MLLFKWSTACKADDFESLRELILLEDFKKCLPDRIVVYINEQKVSTLSSAAVLADEFGLTHRIIFAPSSAEKNREPRQNSPPEVSPKKEERECFYCHKPGHIISNCLALKRKQQLVSNVSPPKSVGLVMKRSYRNSIMCYYVCVLTYVLY